MEEEIARNVEIQREFWAATEWEYEIPSVATSILRDRVSKLNRRAKRLGVPALEITFGEIYLKRLNSFDAMGYGLIESGDQIPVRIAKILGKVPVINGNVELLAIVKRVEDRNMITEISKDFDGSGYADCKIVCDHCKANRSRKSAMLVRHDGEIKMIGTSCRNSFFGKPIAHILWNAWSVFKEMDLLGNFELDQPRISKGGLSTVDYLAAALVVVEDSNGFVKSSEEGSTKYLTGKLLDSCDIRDNELCARIDSKVGEACDLINWAASRACESTFDENLKTAAMASNVTDESSTRGLLCYLTVARRREIERKAEKELRAKKAAAPSVDGSFIGAIGERLEMLVTLNGVRHFESDWGTQTVFLMTDPDENHIVLISGSSPKLFRTPSCDLKIGSSFDVRATVKRHNEKYGQKQTIVSRVHTIREVA